MDAELRQQFKLIERALGLPTQKSKTQQLKDSLKRKLAPLAQQLVEGGDTSRDVTIEWLRTNCNPLVQAVLIDMLIAVLRGKVESKRASATAALAKFGRPAVAALLLKLDKSQSVQSGIRYVDALADIGVNLNERDRVRLYHDLDIALERAGHEEVRLACAREMGALKLHGQRANRNVDDLQVSCTLSGYVLKINEQVCGKTPTLRNRPSTQ